MAHLALRIPFRGSTSGLSRLPGRLYDLHVGRKGTEIELRVKTPHGAAVQGASVRALGPTGVLEAREMGPGLLRLSLFQRGDYEMIVEASPKNSLNFRPFRTVVFFAPGQKAISVLGGMDGGIAGARASISENGRHCIDIVLDYQWFTHIGFPPTAGNRVELLVDGEEGWGAVAQAIQAAQRSIRITTWVYDPQMELVRSDPLADPSAREPYTIHRLLADRAARGALVQLLLWDPPVLPMHPQTFQAALAPDDGFEVLVEKNPTQWPLFEKKHEFSNLLFGELQIGSYHQKTVVCDGRIGFCGGMNLRQNDWDTRLHRIFEPARCNFLRPRGFRRRVLEKFESPDHPPRHDFMARLEGPSVVHLEENFRQRWNRLIERRAPHTERATVVDEPAATEMTGTSAVQVVRTMPAPHEERGIVDVWLRAIRAAKQLIYVEDQYFRSTIVSNALAEAAQKTPQLAIVAITSEAQANHPLTGAWSHACFKRIRDILPDFELYTLRVTGRDRRGKRRILDIDHHGKLLIVDDVFLMVGSCNVNDRGFEYEGECNLAVVDPEFAARTRLALFRDYLDDDPRLGRAMNQDVRVFRERARANAERIPPDAQHPFVVPFVPRHRGAVIFDSRVF